MIFAALLMIASTQATPIALDAEAEEVAHARISEQAVAWVQELAACAPPRKGLFRLFKRAG